MTPHEALYSYSLSLTTTQSQQCPANLLLRRPKASQDRCTTRTQPQPPTLLTLRLKIREVSIPKPGRGEVQVRIKAAALNHRDLFIRQSLYPGISFDNAMLADGYGVVTELGEDVTRKDLLGRNVVVAPMRGWESDPSGPDPKDKFHVAGGTTGSDSGTGRDYMVLSEEDVEIAPAHLSPIEGAAFPLVGLTGWRALVTKSGAAEKGKNVLITGIGGGVALQVLLFAVAFGCNVYVTSGDEDKINKAKKLGAAGGVIYKSATWDKDLKAMLPKNRPYLDAVIDGAGGDIVSKTVRLLRPGGVISQYGMTVGPKMDWLMSAVLANIDIRGVTMGSRAEFREMIAFIDKHKLKPVISGVSKGLDNLDGINGLFDVMRQGKNFGKLVIEIDDGGASPARL